MTRSVGSYQSKVVRHALTRIGGDVERRKYFRRDAICPAVARLTVRHHTERFMVDSRLVNISEAGCMIASDKYPWRDDVLETGRLEGSWFPRISEEVQIFLPWTRTTMEGVIRKQGNYTLNIEFPELLPPSLVDRIARMNPAAAGNIQRPAFGLNSLA